LTEPWHFNQSVLLKVPEGVGPEAVEVALQQLVAHHDALRMRFIRNGDGKWRQEYTKQEGARVLEQMDLRHLPEREWKVVVEREAGRLQKSLDLQAGPLMRAAWFDFGKGERRLFLVIHHLVVDGVSWRILLGDLQRLCGEEAELWRFAVRSSSFGQWVEALEEYAEILAGCGVHPVFTLAAMARNDVCAQPAGAHSVLDIGRDQSELAAFDHGVPTAIRILPWGGEQITQAVAERLRVGPEEAEKLKQKLDADTAPDGELGHSIQGALGIALESLAGCLKGGLNGHQRLCLAGKSARSRDFAPKLSRLLGNGVECERLESGSGPGRSAAILGLRNVVETQGGVPRRPRWAHAHEFLHHCRDPCRRVENSAGVNPQYTLRPQARHKPGHRRPGTNRHHDMLSTGHLLFELRGAREIPARRERVRAPERKNRRPFPAPAQLGGDRGDHIVKRVSRNLTSAAHIGLEETVQREISGSTRGSIALQDQYDA